MANQAVYGIVKNRSQAEKVVQALINAGIVRENISFLSQQGVEFQDIDAVETNRNWRTEERLTNERLTDFPAGTSPEERFRRTDVNAVPKTNVKKSGIGTEKHTKAPEGATTGAAAGGIIGGTLGLLAGIGALAIPGLGPFIAAGPLMATLSGLGAGGTLGGIIGALIGSGIPEYEAKRYENVLKEGGVLLSVRVVSDEEAERVKKILKGQGAEDVTVSSEASMPKKFSK